MNKRRKELLVVIFTLAIFGIVVFSRTLFFNKAFAWYNDQLFQHNVFYQEWYEIIKESIKNRRLSTYSWNTFLGTDYLASKLMYCVGDFFVILLPLFGLQNPNYNLFFATTTIICLVLSGVFLFIYLKKLNIKKDWLYISLPIIYALSGFAMTYTGTYTFHRFYTYLPLLFCCVEDYLNKNKSFIFPIVVFILMLQSYELMFSTCFFLVLYFFVSSKLKDNNIKTLNIIKNSLPLIGQCLIGFLLSGIVIVPQVIYLLNNPRVGSLNSGSLSWDFKTIIGFITSLICPSYNFRSNNPTFLFYTGDHYGQEYGVFTTVLFIIAFLVLIKKGTKKEKNIFLFGELLIIACLFIRPINMIIHGFSVPTMRWSFILIIYHVLLVSYVFDKYNCDVLLLRELIVICIGYVLLLILFLFIYKFENILLSCIVTVASLLLVFIYYLLLKKELYKLLIIVSVLNMVGFYSASVLSTSNEFGVEVEGINQNYLRYFSSQDDDVMYRIHFITEEINPYIGLNRNNSIKYGYMSTYTYDSTYEGILNEFLTINGYNAWTIDIDRLDLMKMLGVKYVASKYIDLSNDNNYVYSYDIENNHVYKIVDYNHIGHTYSTYVTNINDIIDWNNELYISEEIYEKVKDYKQTKKSQLDVIEYNRQYFKANLDVDDKTILFVSIPYSSGWNVYDQDLNKLETINVQGGFLGVFVDSNNTELSFYYGTPGLKIGLCLSAVGFIGEVYLILKRGKSKI